MEHIDVSVIAPVYRETEIIKDFYHELIQVMDRSDVGFEIIFVHDDDSSSDTLRILKGIHDNDSRVVVISLARNFGHQIALTAGIDYARGDAVIMLDSDLQHPPELILTLIDKWKEGYEIVYTIRQDVLGESFFKKFSAKLFYIFMSKISDVDMGLNCADYRLMSRKTVTAFKNIPEKSRFLRGIVSWMGYKKIGVKYVAQERTKGKSKYSMKKILSFAMEGILSFSNFPIRLISSVGLIISSISFIYIVRVGYFILFTDEKIPDVLPISSIILFLSGVQMIMLGIIGEYIAKIFTETKNRPLYLIEEVFDKLEV